MLAACLATLTGCLPRHCIVRGTSIATPTGPRMVEELRVGDAILARLADGSTVPARVTGAVSAFAREHLVLTMDDGTKLRVTSAHPIATPHGFTPAGKLAEGDFVARENDAVTIASVRRVAGKVNVYDLSVEPGNTFFASGVLVHNKTFAQPPRLTQLAGTWVGSVRGVLRYRLELAPDASFALHDTLATPPRSWHGTLPRETPNSDWITRSITSWSKHPPELRLAAADSTSPSPATIAPAFGRDTMQATLRLGRQVSTVQFVHAGRVASFANP